MPDFGITKGMEECVVQGPGSRGMRANRTFGQVQMIFPSQTPNALKANGGILIFPTTNVDEATMKVAILTEALRLKTSYPLKRKEFLRGLRNKNFSALIELFKSSGVTITLQKKGGNYLLKLKKGCPYCRNPDGFVSAVNAAMRSPSFVDFVRQTTRETRAQKITFP